MNNFIEMFSGIGGMGYGLMQAGWNCVGYAEIDKYAHQAYEILHDPEKRMWNAYDVKSVTDDDLRLLRDQRGPIQLLAGGFPCQSFSIAGKRKGFTDATRGTLFFEIIRWASILRPEHLLLENVTGLLNHDNGATFETVIGALDELGYVGEWCVLNSAAYVPQNRERIFIVASLGGSSRPKIFPFGSENGGAIDVIGKLTCYNDQNNRVYGIDGIAPCLPTMQGGGQEPKVMVNVSQITGVKVTENASCLDANYFKGLGCNQARTGVMEITCINPRKEDGTQTYQQDRVYNTDGIMTTLSAELAGRFNILTEVEDEKLQGMRKGNIKGSSNDVLQQRVYESELQRQENNRRSELVHGSQVGEGNQESGELRGVRFNGEPGRTPQGRGLEEQRSGELASLMQGLPHSDSQSEDMHDLRRKTQGEGVLQQTPDKIPQVRQPVDVLRYRIRKLTPLECMRLQSYPDEWYYKLKKAGISDSQLYKMAGNGVTSVVAYEIGKRLVASI